MEVLRFGFAFGGVLLALISNLTTLELSSYALAMFAGLVVLSLNKLNRLALSFTGICVVSAAFVLLSDGTIIDPKAPAFIFAFLLVSGSLRTAASNEKTVQALGMTIVHSPQRHRFTLISLGTGVLALVLLNGALQYVAGIFSEKSNAPLSERLPIMRAIISGFVLNPILSPIAIPFVVTSSLLPEMSWAPLAPYLLGCGITVWISGALQARATSNQTGVVTDGSVREGAVNLVGLLPAILLVLAPIIATVFFIFAFGLKPSQAAFTSIFISSLIWPLFRLRQPRLVFSGYTVAINEAAIIGGSIFLGILLVSYLPASYSEVAGQALITSGAFAPVLILSLFVAGGLIGLQPSICFLLVYAVIQSYADVVGASLAPVMAASIVGWALNSILSPFGIPVMIISGAFGVQTYDFAYKHGLRFLILSVVGCSAVLLLGSLML